MALIGGGGAGGAGNVAGGGNPAGTSFNLNYLGDFCYAYSGIVEQNAGDVTTLLDFTTGSEIAVVKITFDTSATSSDNISYVVLMNTQKISEFVITGSADADPSTKETREYIIPPFTRLQTTAKRTSGSDTQYSDCVLTGRVYA